MTLDASALAAARAELGTTSITDTVNMALREVAAAGARRRFVEALAHGELELADEAVMRSAWR